jgi:uncharacterized LabA/DUF88 family protein
MATNPASSLKPGQKILALVDESHLLAAARAMNKSIDWLAVREYLLDEGESPDNQGEIVVYVGLPPIFVPEFQELRARKLRFVHWLRIHGFLVMTKDGVPSGDNHYKADVDLLMAVDAMDLVQQIKPDTVVLLTGDPDFAHLGLSLRRKGVRVEVATVEQTIGGELRASASAVLDLRPLLQRFDPLRTDGPGRGGDSPRGDAPPRYGQMADMDEMDEG